MKKMISLANRRYGVERLSKGDVFNAYDGDVVLLKAMGWAKDMPLVKAMSTENTSALVPNKEIDLKSFVQEVSSENTNQAETSSQGETDETPQDDETVLNENTQQPSEYSRMLRERAMDLGIRLDGRWSDARVQREIDEYNKRTYQHMDMRATE